MSISIQTNVTSLIAQENLSINQNFESKTIQRLTSGYRINSSGDDAAGLAVANQYRSDIAELTQGVLNANNGVSNLQIIDGGLGNISQMLDRMKTLATESASGTFTGNRGTLNTEYQSLITEITRQASNERTSASSMMARRSCTSIRYSEFRSDWTAMKPPHIPCIVRIMPKQYLVSRHASIHRSVGSYSQH